MKVMLLLFLVILMPAFAFGQSQCNGQKCRAAVLNSEAPGINYCYSATITFSPDDGLPCAWDGTKCVGDPCFTTYTVTVTKAATGSCTGANDCPSRLKEEHTKCSVLVGTSVFIPTDYSGNTYTHSGFVDIPCGCTFSIKVSVNNPPDPSDPCVGGWSFAKGVSCTNCVGL